MKKMLLHLVGFLAVGTVFGTFNGIIYDVNAETVNESSIYLTELAEDGVVETETTGHMDHSGTDMERAGKGEGVADDEESYVTDAIMQAQDTKSQNGNDATKTVAEPLQEEPNRSGVGAADTIQAKNGWFFENGGYKYYKNGTAYTGWHNMGTAEGEKTPHWSYFGSDGRLRTGWVQLGKGTSEPDGNSAKHWSYFGSNGWLRTGWVQLGKGTSETDGNTARHWSYFGSNGWLRTGWVQLGKGTSEPDGNTAKHWSYFGSNGWLRTGWIQLGKGTSEPDGNSAKHWSYFGSNGWLRTGWIQFGKGTSEPDGNTAKHWSYFGNNGWLRTGLQDMGKGTNNPDGNSANHKSYFGDNGWLVVNKEITVSGIKYKANAKGWLDIIPGDPVKLEKNGNTWYLFDSNGSVVQQGKSLYIGSFFESDSNESARYYLTLDGKKMTRLDKVSGKYEGLYSIINKQSKPYVKNTRDANVLAKNGHFYTFFTAKSNNKGNMYDFAVLDTTDFQTFAWKTPNTASGYSDERWAPECFEDDDGNVYVFYSVQYKILNNKPYFETYMTKLKEKNYSNPDFDVARNKHDDFQKWDFSSPVKLTFTGTPKGVTTDNMIDANVVKKNGTYYMIIKREFDKTSNKQASLLIYETTDISSQKWKYLYEITAGKLGELFGKNQDTSYDFRSGEGPCITLIGDTFYLYVDYYDTKGKNYQFPAAGKYLGIYIATSKDLKNWESKGQLTTYTKDPLRHGSVREVKDTTSQNTLMKLYNGGAVVDVPSLKSGYVNYTGKTQSFFDSSDMAYDEQLNKWVCSGTFYYAYYSKEPKDKGTYTVTLKLKNKDKFWWSDNTKTDKVVSCEIK